MIPSQQTIVRSFYDIGMRYTRYTGLAQRRCLKMIFQNHKRQRLPVWSECNYMVKNPTYMMYIHIRFRMHLHIMGFSHGLKEHTYSLEWRDSFASLPESRAMTDVRLRQAVAGNSPPDCCILIFESR